MRPTLLRYDDSITFGESPESDAIEALARERGHRSLLDLDLEGEEDEILSPNVEASWAHTYEMEHRRVSVDPEIDWPAWVDAALLALEQSPKPVYVHSRHGRRAAALLVVHRALERGIDGETALREVRALGVDWSLGDLERRAVEEADARASAERPARPPDQSSESAAPPSSSAR